MKEEKALKNQALYWRGFAYLAVHGKRDLQAWHAACITSVVSPPSDEDVAAILDEAKAVMNTNSQAA